MNVRSKQGSLLAFIAIFIFLLSGCAGTDDSGTSSISTSREDNGDFVITSESYQSVQTEEIPHAIDYNGVDVVLQDVKAFEKQSDYSYTLVCVIALDCSALDDAQYHWLKESDLKVNAYLTSEKNGYDFESGKSIGNVYSDEHKTIFPVFAYEPSAMYENRHSFSGSEIYVSVSLTQEDTYEYISEDGNARNLHFRNELDYKFTVPEDLCGLSDADGGFEEYVLDYFSEN